MSCSFTSRIKWKAKKSKSLKNVNANHYQKENNNNNIFYILHDIICVNIENNGNHYNIALEFGSKSTCYQDDNNNNIKHCQENNNIKKDQFNIKDE